MSERILDQGFKILPVSFSHGLGVGQLPRHHRDLFDRMMIAQTQMESLVPITRDSQVSQYDVEVLLA